MGRATSTVGSRRESGLENRMKWAEDLGPCCVFTRYPCTLFERDLRTDPFTMCSYAGAKAAESAYAPQEPHQKGPLKL